MTDGTKKYSIGVLALVVVAVGAFFLWPQKGVAEKSSERTGTVRSVESHETKARPGKKAGVVPTPKAEAPKPSAVAEDEDSPREEPQTEEEKREAEEEKLVNAFDDLTDAWMDPDSKKQVTMDDVRKFNEQFRKVPQARREECLHRALNLIPDSNVMLLAGILMDKSYDAETLELVYNDVLNRDEDVKKPILREIFKDKTHPCWADTAWILDVTGELPGKKE